MFRVVLLEGHRSWLMQNCGVALGALNTQKGKLSQRRGLIVSP